MGVLDGSTEGDLLLSGSRVVFLQTITQNWWVLKFFFLLPLKKIVDL